MGDGRNSRVWSDNWYLDPLPRRPVNKKILFDVQLKVSSLLDREGKWRIKLLEEFFPDEVAN